MLLCILNLDYPSPEEKSLIYQSKIWLLKPWESCQQTIKAQLSCLKTSQKCHYIPIIGWQEWIKIQMKAESYTMMKQIHTKMTSNQMKEWMQNNIVDEAE